MLDSTDVLVIGAGPAGAIAAGKLATSGHQVLVLEKERFPRFSIGESLLPQCMEFIESAGMMAAIHDAEFQYKNGATFHFGGRRTEFDFRKKFSPGWGTTYQVERATFDNILANEAERLGAEVYYRHEITSADLSGPKPKISYKNDSGREYTTEASFVLDASGFGRVLPRLLDLNTPSDFPIRKSIFTHITDHIDDNTFDRNKILITIHPTNRNLWYWLIPFGKGRASIGVVGESHYLEKHQGELNVVLQEIVNEDPQLKSLLKNAEYNFPVREITGYSCNVKSLHGDGFALLGNAGEFLDPVFSSGVTIAMKSAIMAASLVDRQFNGETVNWKQEFAVPLKKGVDTFRTFVTAWYDQRFQDIIFHDKQLESVREMICSILAGYVWDEENPYVKESERRVDVLAKICRAT